MSTKSLFIPQSKSENLMKASPATQTAISVYFGTSIPIEVFMRLPELKTSEEIQKENKAARALKRKEEIEAFKEFSANLNCFLKIKRSEPYIKDPLDNLDYIAIGNMLVDYSKMTNGPITF